jgi:hypothetical protein
MALFSSGEQGVWYDPSDVANLAWRRNLLTYSEDYSVALGSGGWTKSGVTASGQRITANAATGAAYVETTSASAPASAVTISATFPSTAGRNRYAWVADRSVSPIASATFDLDSVSVVGKATAVTALVVTLPDGSVKCSVTHTRASAGTSSPQFALAGATHTSDRPSLTWAGGEFLDAKMQFEHNSTATDYQRITDVNTEVIERFPTATLFQDPAGTIPVTTPGQAVALMLDKSRGLTLGPELITNGDFSGGSTDWQVSAQCSISGGLARVVSSDGSFQNIGQNKTLSPGIYEFTLTIVERVSGSLQVAFTGGGVSAIGLPTSVGTHRVLMNVTTTASSQVAIYRSGITDITFDNVSLKLIQGNHATQATAASRPIYGVVPQGGRRNLLLQTEAFETASWSKLGTAATVTADNTTDPLGGNTADRIAFAASGIANRVSQVISPASGAVPITLSIWLRGSVGGEVVQISDGWTNSSPLTLTTSWQRFTSSITGNASTTAFMLFAQTGTPTVFAWGAQLEQSATATPYQRVSTVYDVTEAGVPSCSYLFFDGGSDSMATGNIDFTATDKMTVWAGVRKNSDAAAGVLAEFSANYNFNAGSFFFTAPEDTSTRRYASASRGSAASSGLQATTIGPVGAAPDTAVLATTFDIAGDLNTIRRNAVSGTSATGDQGTGNFGNYPLYIGARAGTSLFFNGNLFGLVVRGAASTTAQITATEAWLAPKSTFFSPVITGVPTVGVS